MTSSSGEQRRAKMALFYSKMRQSYHENIKSLVDGDVNDLSLWLLSTSIFSATGSQGGAASSQTDVNAPRYPNLKYKYLNVQTYSNVMNLNQLNLNIPPLVDEESPAAAAGVTFNGEKPLDLMTLIVDLNQSNLVSINKQHIHTWCAVSPQFKLSIPMVCLKTANPTLYTLFNCLLPSKDNFPQNG